ncbi:MAG TPA: tetratricopeptide repeat protein [Thermomonas sp.]|nr:tetratricopeptide repeat protein [Thermomonas sp.]
MSGLLATIAQLHFLRPLWLLGLLALPALAWWSSMRGQRRSVWQDAVDPHLLPHLLEASTLLPRRNLARWSVLLAAALALLAMAGPSLRKAEHPLWQSKAPLVVALDLSSAILARDLPPSRLAQARAKIAMLLRERAGGQVALVAFADDAYTVAPLTEDAANVALFLDALAPDVMPVDGHRADRAIAWSQRLMRNAGFDHGDILLLTDRAASEALAEAARARMAGYRVSVIGLGTARGGVFDTPAGLGNARLDAASLRALAASGGGGYRPLTAGNGDLRALGVLDPQAGDGAAARGGKVASWRDDGYWLLPLAMLLALPLFRRGGVVAALLVVALLLPMPPAHAQQAAAVWRRADQQAYARMQDGVTAYRQEKYDEAIAGFTGNPTADGQYNLGNALARAGRYDEAIAAYDRALKLQPDMQDAIANRRAVDAARKRKPPPGGPSQQDPSPGKPRQQQGDQGPHQQQGQQQGRQGKPQQAPPAKPPPDPKQQQQADAAQRQRMQEALRKQPPQAQGQAAPPAKETAAQRERRIANQAQLQRVPDEPGALLRAKFRLEHERRQGGVR